MGAKGGLVIPDTAVALPGKEAEVELVRKRGSRVLLFP